MWLHGRTGTRKSTLAKMFANVFNRSNDSINCSFEDTVAAIEVKASEYKDSVLIADDYKPAQTAAQKKENEKKKLMPF